MNAANQPWILSARFDGAFILAPAILIALAAILFQAQIAEFEEMPTWLWLILIVGIDAGHVYTTLFRTYLVKDEWRQRQALLTFIPLFAWLAGCLLYSFDSLAFWRVLAYLAMFHFVRQQYGFMMIYDRNERDLPDYFRNIDKAAIYLATLYPLIYWHCHKKTFAWFIAGDIWRIDLPWLSNVFAVLYIGVLCVYVLKEIRLFRLTKTVNLPRNLMIIGTALSWYVGIVAFDNDIIFTATNVIAHGIPYYALIWAYGYKQTLLKNSQSVYFSTWISLLFNRRTALFYFALMFSLAYLEEGVWDGLVWMDHPQFFAAFAWLPKINSPEILTWLVPLLALPQATHYLLDAYIWRLHQANSDWKKILFHPITSNS